MVTTLFKASPSSNIHISNLENLTKDALHRLVSCSIEESRIWPAFQPIVELSSGKLAGFEVLARWGEPNTGSISPVDFIPKLEQFNLIHLLSTELIKSACKAAIGWDGCFSLAFNISPVELLNSSLPDRIAAAAESAGFPLHRIQVEVTESSLASEGQRAEQTLHALNELGIKIAIDDFGTGYSNLSRLAAFPFQKLKIDARFVRDLEQSPSKRRICASVIGLGNSLGMTVVAEGVETPAEEGILKDLGCNLGQGWLYGKGVHASEAQTLQKTLGNAVAVPPLDNSPFQRIHQLVTLYKQTTVGICFLDTEYRHVRVNESYAKMVGIKVSDLEGKFLSEVVTGDLLLTAQRNFAAALVSDAPVIHTFNFGGKTILISCSQVSDIVGEPIGFSVVAVDVSERLQLTSQCSKEAHDSKAAGSEMIFWSAQADGRVNILFSRERVPPRSGGGRKVFCWTEHVPSEDRRRVEEALFANAEETSIVVTFRYMPRPGLQRTVEATAFPQRGSDGSAKFWCGFARYVDASIATDMRTPQNITAALSKYV